VKDILQNDYKELRICASPSTFCILSDLSQK
jgi:hypothetical protein